MFLLDLLVSLIGVFLSVAFLTLVERKFLGYFHFRKGPSKIILAGLTQPISDAVKLFSKGFVYLKFSKFYFFLLAPVLGCFFMCVLWSFYCSFSGVMGWGLQMLLLFSFISLISYFLFFCGFRVVGVYSVVGYVRSVSQVISYEVCVVVSMFFVIYVFSTLSFTVCRFRVLGLNYAFFLPFFLFV
jgi:NADH:ubiquinone oxidoreductase subunit H